MNKKQFQSLKYRAILVIPILLNSAVLSAQVEETEALTTSRHPLSYNTVYKRYHQTE